MPSPSTVARTREERHHHLLRQRQPRGVIERDVPAVGHDAVDELDLTGLEGESAIALVQLLLDRLRVLVDHPVEHVVVVDRDDAQAPAGAAEVLAEGVYAARKRAEQGTGTGHEGPVDVVGEQDEVRAGLQDRADPLDRVLAQGDRARVAGIDHEECLDLRIQQLLELGVGELESVLLGGVHVDYVEVIVLEVRHLQVGGEDRNSAMVSPALSRRLAFVDLTM